jgi:inorganic phosphate transporter, PiT family
VRTKRLNDTVVPAVAALVGDIGKQVRDSGALAQVPAAAVGNVRNDMYLTSEAIRALGKGGVKFEPDTGSLYWLFTKLF